MIFQKDDLFLLYFSLDTAFVKLPWMSLDGSLIILTDQRIVETETYRV
jgi:hypothetical protein